MRLLILSDLHLDHRPSWTLPNSFPPFDVGVFAGDIEGTPQQAVELLAGAPGLRDRPRILVAGNHEFYGGEIEARIADGKRAAAGSNVVFLDGESAVIGGVRFIGATLWTDYALQGTPADAQDVAAMLLNDHRLVSTRDGSRRVRFRPLHALARHTHERAFIEVELETPFAGPTIVVTHHAPHPGSVHPRFGTDPLNAAFASDLSELIARRQPELWVHGHTHCSFDYRAGRTRIVCNPKGYGPHAPGGQRENPDFDEQLVIEL